MKKIVLYPHIYKKYIIECPICNCLEHDISFFLKYTKERRIYLKCINRGVLFVIYACNGEVYMKTEDE